MVAELASRDLFIDLLRASSIALVVLGHWISSTVWWWNGRVGVNSILIELPWLAPASWIVVTVPLLFFVGGFSNMTSYRRMVVSGRQARGFVVHRASRLLGPTTIFLSVWLAVELVLHAADVGGNGLVVGVSSRGLMPFGPLWFLAVYLVVTALCPVTASMHDRFGLAVPVALIIAAACVDTARFVLDVPDIAWANLVLVWLLPHQLGYFYATGALPVRSRFATGALCGAGLVGLVFITSLHTYPTSIGGLPTDELSNMRPPTMVLVALSLWQIGLVLSVRPKVEAILQFRWLIRAVHALNRHAMSIYLWHMTAMLLVVLALAPFGWSEDNQPVALFWFQRPLVLVLSGITLVAITVSLARFEQAGPTLEYGRHRSESGLRHTTVDAP